MKKVIHTLLNIGAEKPFRLLHITDVHIAKTNEKDPEDQIALEKRRVDIFRKEGEFPPFSPSEYLEEALELAHGLGALPVLTGDVFDIQTQGNLAEFHRILDGKEFLYTPGGHEHQKRCHITLDEEDGYWYKSREKLKQALPGIDLDFTCRTVGSVNLIMADNSLDYYNKETVRRYFESLKNGLPTVVFSHDPLRTERLNMATPWTPNMAPINEEDLAESLEMLQDLKTNPQIAAIFTGHSHTERETVYESTTCYETPGLYSGVCRLIEIR